MSAQDDSVLLTAMQLPRAIKLLDEAYALLVRSKHIIESQSNIPHLIEGSLEQAAIDIYDFLAEMRKDSK